MKTLTVIVLVLATLIFAYVSVKPNVIPALHIATASSFAPFLGVITEDIQSHCQIKIQISSGSSGMLATQILNGAPFDIFFSADAVRPAQLEKKGNAAFRQTYAFGHLVYWQPSFKNPDPDDPRPLAIADPVLAPFGQAAMQSLDQLRQEHGLPGDTVWGRSAAQVFQFVATGAAKAGLVPLSLLRLAGVSEDEFFLVTTDWYSPIQQDVAVLRQSRTTDCLLAFLNTPRSKAMMVDAGFGAVP